MRMKTPAITNQYGEMNTGMPNGRATTIPGPDSRRWGGFSAVSGGFSGVVPATLPMLRAVLAGRDDPGNPANVRDLPYGCVVEEVEVLAGGTTPQGPPDHG